MHSTSQIQEPQLTLKLQNSDVTLLGTAHVSRASAAKVKQLVASGDYDAVAVELCASRHSALLNPDALAHMDLLQVLKKGQAPMVAASLALGAYQQRLAEQFNIEPGAEMRMALTAARGANLPALLIDREIGVTLRRIYRNVSWWRRFYLVAGLLASVISREKVSETEIERLKEGDVLETTFAQFADQQRDLYLPLIDERDRYMAARLRQELASQGYRHILAVVGAGHLQGIAKYLTQAAVDPAPLLRELEQTPPASRWPRLLPWLVVGLVLLGFVIGFSESTALGWQLVVDWTLINGGLAAAGALLAGGHPLTVLSAFIAAPLTSLNPTIGAGMVTAAVEIMLRKPKVGDFSRLRQDTAHLKGWRRNRVARTLLVFLLSTLGSALGTYIAGFRIFERLTG